MEIREDNFIKIDNKYIRDNDYILDKKELVLLILINTNLTVKNDCIFTIGYLMDMLDYSNNNKKIFSEIKEILNLLSNDEIIQLYTDRRTKSILFDEGILNLSKNEFIYCDATKLNNLNDNFTLLYDDELYELLKLADIYNIDKFQLIQLFVLILSYINNNDDMSNEHDYLLAYPSYQLIDDRIGLSPHTIEKYINILKDNELLYFDYAGYTVSANGDIRNTKMYYCRYRDKEKVINRIKEERENGIITYNKLSRNKGNLKRSLKQIINKLTSKKEELTKEDILKLDLLNKEYKKLM